MREASGKATRFPCCSTASWASYALPWLWPPRASSRRRLGLCAVWGASWPAASHSDAQRLVFQLPASGVVTKLFSDNVKTIAIGTELCLHRLHILSEPLYLWGSPLQRPRPGTFICLLGRHVLPQQFHRKDLANFMKAGRCATAAVTQLSLPSHYPIRM